MYIGKLRNIIVSLVFALCLGVFFNNTVAVGATGFPDTQMHWAEKSINFWAAKGYIEGYANGKFMPDQAITRAEFCTFVNKLMGFKKVSNTHFSDLKGNEWYALEMRKAVGAGYLHGYPDGTIRANRGITRAEMASIIYNILTLRSAQKDYLGKYIDREDVQDWSYIPVNAVVWNDYMSGFPDRTFRPGSTVTRAETLAIFDRVVGTLYDKPGFHGLSYNNITLTGNAFINSSNVTLRNVTIEGDLIITEGAGQGSVTLFNVKVNRVVKTNAGLIVNDSNLAEVLVEHTNNNQLRLLAQGTTEIKTLDVRTSVILEEANLAGTGFNDVVLKNPQGAKVQLDGIFKDVNVETPLVQLDFLQGTMDSLALSLAARDAKVNLNSNTTVKKLSVINKASIEGRGVINNAEVYGDGVVFDRAPKSIKIAPGVKAKVNGRTVTGTRTYNSGDYYDRAPYFVNKYPFVENIFSRGFDLVLKADRACKAYYVILEEEERIPSSDEVIAGEDADGRSVGSNYRGYVSLSANKEKIVEIDGLRVDQDYCVYLVLDNSAVEIDPPVIRVRVTTEDSEYGNLSGEVTTANGTPIKGVKVTVKKGSTTIDSTTTDSNGTYLIYDLESGTYTMVFSKSGYESAQTTQVIVSRGKTKYVDKILR